MLEKLREQLLRMADLPVEEVHVWFVDVNGAVINHWVAGVGRKDKASIQPRELFRLAWEYNAHAIVIAHNHPNGNPTPSCEDDEFTAHIRILGGQCDTVLLDHFVVGDNSVYSFTENSYFNLVQPASAIAS